MRTSASFGPEQIAIAQRCSQRLARHFHGLQPADIDELHQIGLETALRMWPRFRDHIGDDFEAYIGRAVAVRMTHYVRNIGYAATIPVHVFTELKHAKKHSPSRANRIGDMLDRFRAAPLDEMDGLAAEGSDDVGVSRAEIVRDLAAEHIGVAMAARVAAGEGARAVAAEHGMRQGEAKRLRDAGAELVRQTFTPTKPQPERWDGIMATLQLHSGTYYEMVHVGGWHSVRPIGTPSLSLMVTRPPWDEPTDAPKPTKRLRPLTVAEGMALMTDVWRFFGGLLPFYVGPTGDTEGK